VSTVGKSYGGTNAKKVEKSYIHNRRSHMRQREIKSKKRSVEREMNNGRKISSKRAINERERRKQHKNMCKKEGQRAKKADTAKRAKKLESAIRNRNTRRTDGRIW
jgi:hypothetical protein